MIGLIVKAISSFYYVDFENTIYECKARGNFRKMGVSPVVGDYVEFSPTDLSHGVIEEIKPRKNCLSRPVIANIDKIIIVSSFSCPSPDTLIIDRLTAVAVYYGIEPIIVFNKSDTGDFSEYKKIYQNAGFKVFVVSAKENIGIDDLREEIGSSFCAFAGNSGVGKSSIINCLFGDLNLRTGEVSQKLGRGRHTTRHTELFKTPMGGYIADTPGFSSFESEHERRLEHNRENHEKTMSGLNSQYTTAQNFYKNNKNKEKAQNVSIIENFERIKNKRQKSIIFYALKKNYLVGKNLKNKHNTIFNELNLRKKFIIFNTWRNITSSFKKNKIKLMNNQQFLEESKKVEEECQGELSHLKLVLESLEKDIQKEINERKSLAKLYDLSLKKGVEAFLRETNYIIDFDASRAQTPNERSFVDAENNYNRYVQKEEEIKENINEY